MFGYGNLFPLDDVRMAICCFSSSHAGNGFPLYAHSVLRSASHSYRAGGNQSVAPADRRAGAAWAASALFADDRLGLALSPGYHFARSDGQTGSGPDV